MSQCYFCQTPYALSLEEIHFARPPRNSECAHCKRDLHNCLNCQFYDPGSYNECKERMAERITDKEKANFCDYYQLRNSSYSLTGNSSEDHLIAALKLFKKDE